MLLGPVLEALFEVVGHGRQQHGFVRAGSTGAPVEPAQAVVQQIPEDGLDRALAHPSLPLPLPGVLAEPGAAVDRIVNRAVDLLAPGPRRARGLARALLAVAARGPVNLVPVPVLVRVVLLKRQGLAFGVGKGGGAPVVGEAFDGGLVLARDRSPGRNVRGLEPGVTGAVGVAGIG